MADTTHERNPYAAPVARVDDVHVRPEDALAPRLQRLRAYMLDAVLIALCAMLAAVIGSELQDSGIAGAAAISRIVLIAGSPLIALVVVNVLWLYRYGQTVGKRFVGIRMVRSDQSRASLPRLLFLRIFVPIVLQSLPWIGSIFWLADVLWIFREPRRCLHDYIADTIVIKA